MASMMRRWVGWCAGVAVGVGGWAAPAAAQGVAVAPHAPGASVYAPEVVYGGPVAGPAAGFEDGGCATGHCADGTCGGAKCGLCGLKQYPLSEKRYIRQFCGPTICPGGCFGHFKPQWTRWTDACPNWCANDAVAGAVVPGAGAPPLIGGQPVPPQTPAAQSAAPAQPAVRNSDASAAPTPMPLPAPATAPSSDLPPLKEPERAKPSTLPAPTNPPAAQPDKPKDPSPSSALPVPTTPRPSADPRLVVPAIPDVSGVPAIPVSAPVKF